MTSEGDWDETLENDIPRLATLLRETGAEEIEVGCGDRTIRLRRSMVEAMDIPNAESSEEQTVWGIRLLRRNKWVCSELLLRLGHCR